MWRVNFAAGAISFLLLLWVAPTVAPPPNRAAAEAAAGENEQQANGQQPPVQPPPHDQKPLYEFTYSRYLEEVVKVLESDPMFNEKLRSMPEADIKAGKIADHMDNLPDPLYERLHKLKYAELERLREQINQQVEAEGGVNNVKLPEHIDLQNWEKFSKEDLRMLVKKTVADMEEIDKQRRESFKEYELKKKAEEDHKLAQLSPEQREAAEREAAEAAARHNQHEKLKHPGSRDQLEEVWEDSDKMDKENYDPRTFFALHDLNGDGYWNQEELEALFQSELEKMYNETNPDDDPREKMEEMYRMRDHVLRQMDKNGDRLITLQEFLTDTEAQTAYKDPGWDDLGQQKVYTDEELKRFEEEYAKQQGWGPDAYAYHGETTLAPSVTPPHQPIQPAEVHRGGVEGGGKAPPVQHQAAVPINVAPIEQHQQVEPAAHVPIKDAKLDPSYGI